MPDRWVDRLSRSLLDVSLIRRLTLNVLLSFAQFEREIIAERTSDKMGAARRKGMWSGGPPILEYDHTLPCSRQEPAVEVHRWPAVGSQNRRHVESGTTEANMPADFDEVIEAALKLPPEARGALASRLLDSLQGESVDADAEAAWKSEIVKRVADLDQGLVRPVPWSEARQSIRPSR